MVDGSAYSGEWQPEYTAENVVPPNDRPTMTFSSRGTRTSLAWLVEKQYTKRKTKIIATLGPACWDKETLGEMIDAGMNIARLNFSHGTHEQHLEVLERLREVSREKNKHVAVMVDTAGPEVKTSRLRGGRPISLVFGQDILIEALGERYGTWEGYQDAGETRIGVSYDRLCQSLKPGDRIMLQDGQVSVDVVEVVSDRVLRGRVLNGGMLREISSVNFPGTKLDIPVLEGKDVYDLQHFAIRHRVDFVAASFVQTREDAEHVRATLDAAGGGFVKLISKIEDDIGLKNIDEVIGASDGIMVARGDLGTEIPPERVSLAQKMIITKCNIAGKFVIIARQMLQSMRTNPIPTRAEMTDVANAVFDGTDCVMLSGETAVGAFPVSAVQTMCNVTATAELGLNYYSQFLFIRFWNYHRNTITPLEATLASAAKSAVELAEDNQTDGVIEAKDCILTVVISHNGTAANIISKYRPQGMILVVTDRPETAYGCASWYGQEPYLVPSLTKTPEGDRLSVRKLLREALEYARGTGLLLPEQRVVFATGATEASADEHAMVSFSELTPLVRHKTNWPKSGKAAAAAAALVGGAEKLKPPERLKREAEKPYVQSLNTTAIDSNMLIHDEGTVRRTKIVCRLGPSCWSEEMLEMMLEGGMNIARFSSHDGSLRELTDVVQRFRGVCERKGSQAAMLLDVEGPTIRTAMLRGGEPILLEAGQDVIIEALGPAQKTWEGYKDGRETRIGISYSRLCEKVSVGDRIILQEGAIAVDVAEILGPTQLRGVVQNSCLLGQRKLCCIPGVSLDLPVLTSKDVYDLKHFCVKHRFDYVAIPRVQSQKDVELVRNTLDRVDGGFVKLISKIEDEAGLRNIDEIIAASDGVMVGRSTLGTEIPVAKVSMAQKMIITKSNIAGKFVITGGQMLQSMCENALPTRAEMTDVANAVFDGSDCVMLSAETAEGMYPLQALHIMSAITANADLGINTKEVYDFIRNKTPKPMKLREAICSSAVQAALDMEACMIVVFTDELLNAILIAKWRPSVPIVVVTTKESISRECNAHKGLFALVVQEITTVDDILPDIITFARSRKLAQLVSGDAHGDQIIVVNGIDMAMEGPNLEMSAVIHGDETAQLVPQTAYEGKHTFTQRSVKVSMNLVCEPTFSVRKTKILGTAGPACSSEEVMAKLLKAGLNIVRFNFSHGTHESHLELLNRFRKVCEREGSDAAFLLDTKGPEIRTAMLKDHQPILLEKGQELVIEAVGSRYTEWEGYKTKEETRIGLSYDKLCQSVKVGGKILIADGSIVIEVKEIVDEKVLKGTVLNSKELGERKNCNLPGVQVDIPVLMEKDIDDLQNFCAKHKMDYVAASFVQSGADVAHIRRMLDDAGGQPIKIISKIENEAGLRNIDEIIAESDGIMVARGDLGMEIPSEKVALAQKMIITKCNVAGKFVVTATQMLESMCNNPRPTRAEMTDVANAVFDGTDCVMLSGETANGKYPDKSVATMAAVVKDAEVGVNYFQVGNFMREFTPQPMGTLEALLSCVAKNAVDINAGIIVIFSEHGVSPRLTAKYRPCVPIIVVTSSDQIARHCNGSFALYPYKIDRPVKGLKHGNEILDKVLQWGVETRKCPAGSTAIVVKGLCVNDAYPSILMRQVPGTRELQVAPADQRQYDSDNNSTVSIRCSAISLDEFRPVRKTKIIVTLGPACMGVDAMGKLLDAGLNIARFNFSHGTFDQHLRVLQRFRALCDQKGKSAAVMIDIKGPGIRTAMLRDHQPIQLTEGQDIYVQSVGANYDTWEGYQDDKETRIGLSYTKLCQSVSKGDRILLGNGTITITVKAILSDTLLEGTVVNTALVAERMNCVLPGVHVDLPIVAEDDIEVLKFAVRNNFDYVAASFIQSAKDLAIIRRHLDEAGGYDVKIIAKIANKAGLRNIDEIIAHADGILVARGNLGMEIPSEKVALAQKMILTKCNLAGTLVITARQMLESMINNPLPTRAEMTDVANAVFDGTDCVMLAGETACGRFPDTSVSTMAAIVQNAELVNNYYATFSFIRDFTPKPFHEMESIASSAARACIDCKAVLCIVITTDGENARLVTKYRPHVPVVVVSPTYAVVQEASARFGQYGCLVPDIQNVFGKDGPVTVGLEMAKAQKLILPSGGQVVVVADSVTGMYFLSSFSVEKAKLVN